MPSRFHDTAKILLAASPVWAVMPAAVERVPVGHVITATHGLLCQRVQCIGPLDIGGTDLPCLSDMLRRAASYQDVRANHPDQGHRCGPEGASARREQVVHSNRCMWSTRAGAA